MDTKHVLSLKAFDAQKMHKVNLFETERMFCDIYCFEAWTGAKDPYARRLRQ